MIEQLRTDYRAMQGMIFDLVFADVATPELDGLRMCRAIKGSKRLGLTWKDHALCYVVASVAVSAIVGLDRLIR